MLLKDLWQVNILEKRLVEKREQLALVADGKALAVAIQSTYQPEEMIEAVRPVVATYLKATIAEIEAQLRILGVEVSAAGDG